MAIAASARHTTDPLRFPIKVDRPDSSVSVLDQPDHFRGGNPSHPEGEPPPRLLPPDCVMLGMGWTE